MQPIARAAVATAFAWFAIGGASVVASAHAEFQSSRVDANSTTQVVLDVPHERAPDVFNTIVRVQMPSGWSSPSCVAPTGWSCNSGGGQVAFTKSDPSSIVNSSEQFMFALNAPSATGSTTFPVVQIYDTGENVLWSSSAQLQVVSGPAPTTPSPAPTTPGPGPGPGPNPGASTATGADSTASTGPTMSVADSPGTTLGVTTDGESTTTTQMPSEATASRSGTPILLVVIVALVVVGAVCAGIVLQRKRS